MPGRPGTLWHGGCHGQVLCKGGALLVMKNGSVPKWLQGTMTKRTIVTRLGTLSHLWFTGARGQEWSSLGLV